jgi:glycosyltransferase involved in cell wall biosynthesis
MRVLNVNSLIDPVLGGGTVERTLQTSRALAAAGHSVGVLTLDIGVDGHPPILLPPVQLFILKSLNRRFQIPRVSIAWLCALVAKYDVIHLMGHWSMLNAMVASAARSQRVPYVVCPAGALPVFGRSRVLKELYNMALGQKLIREANAWIAVTDAERQHFASYGIDPAKVTVIPNGIDPGDYADLADSAGRAMSATAGAPYVLFMGRLNPIKGPDLLLEAFALIQRQMPQVHLVFAGPDGGLLQELRQRSAALALQLRVHFVGYLGGRQKLAAYRGASLLAIPSRSEAMSFVAIEAGASGLPVVLTDQCGFNEVQSVGGGLVVAANAGSIAQALRDLLAMDSAQLKDMGLRLQTHVQAHYTWRAAIGQYVALYDRIAKLRKDSS